SYVTEIYDGKRSLYNRKGGAHSAEYASVLHLFLHPVFLYLFICGMAVGSPSACIYRSYCCKSWCPLRSVASNLRIWRSFDSPPAPPLCRKAASGLSDDHADSRDDGIRHGNRAVEGLSDALVGLPGFPHQSQRICLPGRAASLWSRRACDPYFAAPELSVQYRKLPDKFRTVLCICLLGIFVIDVVFSLMHPNAGFGVTIPSP